MKTAIFATAWFLLVGSACKPSVGPPISLISGPAILAVKGVPAEVDPKATDTTVRYEALAVDIGGRVPGVDADIRMPLLWASCLEPKPPTETNSVSANCLNANVHPGNLGDSYSTYAARVPADACSLFGPVIPQPAEGQPVIRPRDADITGGYYLPLRVELLVPEELRRAGMATADSLISFQLERIFCGLANAPATAIREYGAKYVLNKNPVIGSLMLQQPGLEAVAAPPGGAIGSPVPVANGQPLTLVAYWPEDSVESYPAYDIVNRILVTHREAMRVSWYATAGTFEHDVTGRGETESETFAENTWKPEAPGLVHMWLVLHDSRGGTDFAAYDFNVTP